MINPLEHKNIKGLLKTRADGSLIKRESTTLEFKSDFDWDIRSSRIKYLKTVAAFANKSGGYIVFGVSDTPRQLVGITKPFMIIDDAQISQFFNQYISPCPNFEREELKIGDKRFGFIYIYPSDTKPVVCIKDYDNILRESSIYFRYSAQSCLIKSGDLIHLIEEAKKREADRWMKLFSKVSSIGINKVGVFDFEKGKISTQKGNSFILDEKLLKRIKVLDQYSEQADGAEAVKIIGNIDRSGAVINRPFAIHDDDIISSFLLNKEVLEPKEYIESMCYQSSGYLPIYFFVLKAGISPKEALILLKKTKSRSQSKKRLMSRLTDDNKLEIIGSSYPIDNTTSVRIKRNNYYNNLLNNEEINYSTTGEVKRLLEAVCNLTFGTFDMNFVKEILMDVFNNYYETNLGTFIRQTICYIDLIENKK